MSRGGGPILGGTRVKSRTSGPQWTGRRRKSNRFAKAGPPGTDGSRRRGRSCGRRISRRKGVWGVIRAAQEQSCQECTIIIGVADLPLAGHLKLRACLVKRSASHLGPLELPGILRGDVGLPNRASLLLFFKFDLRC